MTDTELEDINRERKRRSLFPLTRAQTEAAVSCWRKTIPDALDTNINDFILGLSGVPVMTASGMGGYAIHEGMMNAPDPPPSNEPASSADCSVDQGSSVPDTGGSCDTSSFDISGGS